MTEKQAIRLLHPDTTAEAIAEIEYKHGFKSWYMIMPNVLNVAEMILNMA